MTDIDKAVQSAIESAIPGAVVTPTPVAPPVPTKVEVPGYVAANICKMLEKVAVTGLESFALVEAYQIMQQVAVQNGAASLLQGSGVPFQGLGR